MIRTAIICPNEDLAVQLERQLTMFRNIGVERVLRQYPNELRLSAFLKASAPELIFLSAEHPSIAPS